MDILGYVGFTVLIFLAVTWTLGVRVKLDAGVHTIVGALFFLVAAVVLAVSGVDKLHSLWIILTGFVLSILVSLLAIHIPPVFALFRLLASAFASAVRIGIPAEQIKAAQEAGLKETLEKWVSTKSNKEQ